MRELQKYNIFGMYVFSVILKVFAFPYGQKPRYLKTLNIGTPRITTVVVLNIKQFNITMQ